MCQVLKIIQNKPRYTQNKKLHKSCKKFQQNYVGKDPRLVTWLE